jgi:hypothetical protein
MRSDRFNFGSATKADQDRGMSCSSSMNFFHASMCSHFSLWDDLPSSVRHDENSVAIECFPDRSNFV